MTTTQNPTTVRYAITARNETSNDLIGAYNLFKAVQNRDGAEVARLLASGVDADAGGKEDRYGNLPLQSAAMIGGADGARIVGLLLDAGAAIDHEGDYNATALHRAVYEDHHDDWATARLLVRRGACVDAGTYDKDGCNAPEAALLQGNQGAVLAMLEEGLSPNTMGLAGPLIWYAAWDSPEVVKKLLDMGVPHDGGGHVDPIFGRMSPIMRAAESLGNDDEFDPLSGAGACLLHLLDAGASMDKTVWDLLGRHAGAVRAFLDTRSLDTPEVLAEPEHGGRRI